MNAVWVIKSSHDFYFNDTTGNILAIIEDSIRAVHLFEKSVELTFSKRKDISYEFTYTTDKMICKITEKAREYWANQVDEITYLVAIRHNFLDKADHL